MRLFIISLLISVAVSMNAAAPSDEGVLFQDNTPLNDVMQEAKRAGKWVLVDCYTSWCGPCKQMMREVFPQPQVGEYVNARFISVKIDMEKGEGPELAKRYAVRGYPTFLFFSPDGELRHQTLGGCEAADFILLCERAMKGYSIDDLRRQYEAGKRDEDFLISYLYELYDHNQRDESMAIALQLLDGKEEQLLSNNPLYRLFLRFDRDFYSPRMAYVMAHRQDFETRYDSLELAKKVDMLINMTPGLSFQYDKEKSVYHVDEAGIDRFVQTMRDYGIPDWHQREMNPRLLAAEYQRQWDKYVTICDQYIREGFSDDNTIALWIRRTYPNTNDQSHRIIRKWIKNRLQALGHDKGNRWIDEYKSLQTSLK